MAVLEGDVENSAVLLGQSAGIINFLESAEDLITKLVKDAETHLRNASANIK